MQNQSRAAYAGARVQGGKGVPREGDSPRGAEKRKFERRSFGQPALLHEIDSYGAPGDGVECEAMDVSRSGVGLRCKRMVHKGRRVVVVVRAADGKSRVLHGEVRYSRYDSQGLYHVGVQFESMPQTQAFQRWMVDQKLG